MSISQQIAKQLRDVHTGGNWTASNLKNLLADVSWQQATQKVHNLNTIAALVYHINYYIDGVTRVLEGQPLTISDKYSYACPPINSEEDWSRLTTKSFADAEAFATLIEQLPDSKLDEPFEGGAYGNYYRNLTGITEHFHYHLGQIAVIKKIVQQL